MRRWGVLAGASCALAMLLIDQTIVAIALPQISTDLSLAPGTVSWVVNAYVLAYASTVAFGGRIGDWLGHRRTGIAAIVVFVVASVAAGAATDVFWLLIARAVQGVAAAFAQPSVTALVIDAFDDSARGRAMGIFVGIGQLALAAGPLVGGLLADTGSWRWIFFINVPVGLAALGLTARFARDQVSPGRRPRDLTGVALLTVGLVSLVGALQSYHVLGTATWLPVAIGLVALGWFVRRESRLADPLVDVRLLASARFRLNTVVLGACQFAVVPATIWAAIALQGVFGLSAFDAGLAVMPYVVMSAVGALTGGRVYDRIGVIAPARSGVLVAAAGLAAIGVAFALHILVLALFAFAVGGLGLGLAVAPLLTDAIESAGADRRAQASGLLQTVRWGAGAGGTAVIGSAVLILQPSIAAPTAIGAGFVLMAAVLFSAAPAVKRSGATVSRSKAA